LLVVGCWLLVVGCWLLVVGRWLLVVGCWSILKYKKIRTYPLNQQNPFFISRCEF